MLRRQIAGSPEPVVNRLRGPRARPRGSHHDKGRQILVHRPQAVTEPRAQAGPARELVAGANISHRRVMVDRLGPDRLDKSHVVGEPGRPGQELAHPHAGLAVLRELVLGGSDREPRLAAGHRRQALAFANRLGQVLVEHGVHLGLIVEQVHLRRPAVHEKINRPLRLGGEMGQTRQAAGERGGRGRAGGRGGLASRVLLPRASPARPFPGPGPYDQRSACASFAQYIHESGPLVALR